jgi:CubicO group peptidase (beta-lactamase class C family)
LNKSFTALAVMQLVEECKIELDAPVQCYLPWFRVADPQSSAAITVRHLLNQTSGLPMLPGMTSLSNFDNHLDAVERQARSGHLGLLGMRERVHSIGGEIEFASRTGQGTRVRVVVPRR